MRVTRLPVDPGPAGWNALLPPPPPAQVLDGDIAADWLVIGGGFAGLAAARRLTQLAPGSRIVLLEARRIAEGPAGRNSGVMVDLPHDLASDDYGGALDHDLAQTRANRHAIRFAARMARDFALPDEAYRPVGKINAAASPRGHRHNLDFAAHLSRMDEPCTLHDAAGMADSSSSAPAASPRITFSNRSMTRARSARPSMARTCSAEVSPWPWLIA
jgi:glycine/D-amino acid oxidase-like deaminating enzyme